MPTSDYSYEIRKAVRFYWRTKKAAHTKNRAGQRVDAGNRGGATAGKNLDGFSSNPSVHFDADPVFKTASYQERMRILCERMVQERLYTAAAVLTTPPNAAKSGDFADLSTATSLNRLLQKFLAHVQIETGG